MKPEQERVKTVLIDTVSLLCKNGLHFDRELKIEAVIGISVDTNDVFIVHINETISQAGSGGGSGTVSSSAASVDTSLAVVPYSPGVAHTMQGAQMKRPLDVRKTPLSAAKRMRGGMGGASPMGDIARQKAKQQLRFPSPGKLTANASPVHGGALASPSGLISPSAIRSPGVSSGSPLVRGSPRGSGARGGIARGSPLAAGRGLSPRGMGRGSPRGMSRGSSRGRGLVRGAGHLHSGVEASVKAEVDASIGKTYKEVPSPQVYSSPSKNVCQTPTNYGLYEQFMPQGVASSGQSNQPATANMARKEQVSMAQGGNPQTNVYGFNTNYPLNSQASGVQRGSFADINPSVEFGFGKSTFPPTPSFAENVPQPAINIKTESDDADVIFVEDDNVADGTNSTPSAANQSSSGQYVDPSDMYADMSGSGDVVQHITRKVTITTNIQGQNVKYEQVQHAVATLPGPSAPGEGAANLDSGVTDAGHRYSDVPSQSLPAAASQFQQGAAMYGPSSYGQPSNNAAQPLWDQGPAISRMPARQQTPRGAMSSPGMSSMRMPVSRTPAGRGMRLANPQSVRSAVQSPVAKKSASNSGSGSSLPPLSDVGIGGGSAEDGTAWSMIARFMCGVSGCGATFTKKQNLQRHQSQKHGRQKQSAKQSKNFAGEFNDLEGDDSEEYEEDEGFL